MIHGLLNPEKIWHEILQVCPPHLLDGQTCKIFIFQTLEATNRASCGLSSEALTKTGCDVWQLECQASNVIASVLR